MAESDKGSIRDKPPHIHLFWRFYFWDVRTDADNFGNRGLNSGGFEPDGKKNAIASLDGHEGSVDVKFMRTRNKKKKDDEKGVPIGLLTADLRQMPAEDDEESPEEKAPVKVSLRLKPPADHNSNGPASPKTDSPRLTAKWNDSWQIQMREIVFKDLELDKDGYFVVDKHKFFDNHKEPVKITPAKKTDKNYVMHACFIDPDERKEGLAPNAYIKIYPREKRRKKPDFQLIEIDWEFDVLRPNNDKKYFPKSAKNHYRDKLRKEHRPGNYSKLSKDEKAEVDKKIDEDHKSDLRELKKKDEDGKKRVWYDDRVKDLGRGRFNEPFLVMHITTGNKVESAIWTLSGDAAIHYICCLNGHIIKMVEDSTGCFHAGWKNQSKWRDFNWGTSIAVNKTAIGIEHVGVPDQAWPEDQALGSARIAKIICAKDNHNIAAVNIMRHRDLGGAREGSHEWGKDCPGNKAPWWIYQEKGVAIWPLGLRAGDPETKLPVGENFFHGIFDLVEEHRPVGKNRFQSDSSSKVGVTKGPKGKYVNSPLKDPSPANQEKQKKAIAEVKHYLSLIGYHPIKKNKSNAEAWDLPAMHCVRMCQQRFMNAPVNENAGADGSHGPFVKPLFESHVCRDTAEILWRVCQHKSDKVLPGLKKRGEKPAEEEKDD